MSCIAIVSLSWCPFRFASAKVRHFSELTKHLCVFFEFFLKKVAYPCFCMLVYAVSGINLLGLRYRIR